VLCLRAVTVINVVCIQAHSLIERIHDVDLLSLDAKSVAEVRQFFSYWLLQVYAMNVCSSYVSK